MSLFRIIFRRILTGIPLLIFLSMITFFLMHLVPGNYFDALRLNPEISETTIRRYEAMYHLDQPLPVQYLIWLKNLLHFDFGYSFAYRQPVLEVLGSRLWNTFLLSSVSFAIAWLAAVALGLWAGMRPFGFLDRVSRCVAYFGLSMPNFFLCLILLWAASATGVFPLGGMRSVSFESFPWWQKILDVGHHMVLPVLVLSLSSFAYLFRLMRAQTIDVKDRDFVLFLRSLRLSEKTIVFKHIGRNAINPLVTLFGLELPALFSGAALVEIFTGWPGLGQMMLQAVRTQDLFLVLGNMMMIGVLLIVGNLAADLFLVAVDPRIRMQGKAR